MALTLVRICSLMVEQLHTRAPSLVCSLSPIQRVEGDFGLHHLCATNGLSLHYRGTKYLFLALSDQEHAPRVHIRFAVADVRRPVVAETPWLHDLR